MRLWYGMKGKGCAKKVQNADQTRENGANGLIQAIHSSPFRFARQKGQKTKGSWIKQKDIENKNASKQYNSDIEARNALSFAFGSGLKQVPIMRQICVINISDLC